MADGFPLTEAGSETGGWAKSLIASSWLRQLALPSNDGTGQRFGLHVLRGLNPQLTPAPRHAKV